MAGVLRVSQDWIVGDSKDGGPDMDLSLEEFRQEIEYLPTKEMFLKQVMNAVKSKSDILSKGFDDCSLGYMGENYEDNAIKYDYVSESLVLNLNISKKTTRNLEDLTELAWPLLMAKRIDKTNGVKNRLYQLMLINPSLVNEKVYYNFKHQSRMMGVEVEMSHYPEEHKIANLISGSDSSM